MKNFQSPKLIDEISLASTLWTAWVDVRKNSKTEDGYSHSTNRFHAKATENIELLSTLLKTQEYAPQPFHTLRIPKEEGGSRKLSLSSVRDRIIERAIVDVCSPFLDAAVSPAAHAYRPGRGVHTAIRDLIEARDDGFTWILRADIDNCFDNIDPQYAISCAINNLPDSSINWLLALLIDRSGTAKDQNGIAQGSPLSPILMNLALKEFDESVQDFGFPLIRYSDDLAIPGNSRYELEQCQEFICKRLEEKGMKLNTDSEIMSFNDGFCFLGEDIGPVYPKSEDIADQDAPSTKTLYVSRRGALIRCAQGQLVIESKNQAKKVTFPQQHVRSLMIFGSASLTSGVRTWALYEGKDIHYISRRGNYMGSLHSFNSPTRPIRLRKQLEFSDDASRSMLLAQEIITAKIDHQLTLLRRYNYKAKAEDIVADIEYMESLREQVPTATDRNALMGLEGSCARAYFHGFGQLVPAEVSFETRSRRPPRDILNSALSYAYAVLVSESATALVAAGLEPNIGVLHSSNSATPRPSLALDLAEEFRPYVVDLVVMSLARRGYLKPEHGAPDPGNPNGVLLNAAGKKTLLKAYENRMLRRQKGAAPDFSGSIRRLLYHQAQRIMLAIERGEPFRGLIWR